MNQEKSVVVVGGANVDIGGMPSGKLLERDSNPGRVRISVGGVGRNIAHNLRLLELPVTFLTALGKDAHGDRVIGECALAGMDCERILRTHEEPTSTYLFIADEQGDMRVAISDMEICRLISPAYLAENQDILDSAAAIVADANLAEESLRYLAENCRAPLFVDPVSVSKSGRLKGILSQIHTLKPNRMEAELLSGIPIQGPEDLPKAAETLLKAGMNRVFLSLGSEGVFAAEKGNCCCLPCCPAEVRNMTGAGDAMMAGLVWSFVHERSLEESALAGAASAAIAVEGTHTVNPGLSPETLMEKMRS